MVAKGVGQVTELRFFQQNSFKSNTNSSPLLNVDLL